MVGECYFCNLLVMFKHGVSIHTQWIMDVLVCNGLGVYLGMKTCDYLGNKVQCSFHLIVCALLIK